MKARLLFLFFSILVCLECQGRSVCQGKDSVIVVSTLDTLRSGQISITYDIQSSDYDNDAPISKFSEDARKIEAEIEKSHPADNDGTGDLKVHFLNEYYDRQWIPISNMLNEFFAEGNGAKLSYSIYKKYFNPEGKIDDRTNLFYVIAYNCDGKIQAVTIRFWRLLPSEVALFSVSKDNCIRFFEELTNSLKIPKWDGSEWFRSCTSIDDYLKYF